MRLAAIGLATLACSLVWSRVHARLGFPAFSRVYAIELALYALAVSIVTRRLEGCRRVGRRETSSSSSSRLWPCGSRSSGRRRSSRTTCTATSGTARFRPRASTPTASFPRRRSSRCCAMPRCFRSSTVAPMRPRFIRLRRRSRSSLHVLHRRRDRARGQARHGGVRPRHRRAAGDHAAPPGRGPEESHRLRVASARVLGGGAERPHRCRSPSR